jgi:hypothetical protein
MVHVNNSIRLLRKHEDYGLNNLYGDSGAVGVEWLEIGRSENRHAEQFPDGHFAINHRQPKALLLQPVLNTGSFSSLDELAQALVGKGAVLTDLRQPLGFIDNVCDVYERLEGNIIELIHRWPMLMAPRVDGRHEDFWFVDSDVFHAMKQFKLIQLTSGRAYSSYYIETYSKGPKTPEDEVRWGWRVPLTKAEVAVVEQPATYHSYRGGLLAPSRWKMKLPLHLQPRTPPVPETSSPSAPLVDTVPVPVPARTDVQPSYRTGTPKGGLIPAIGSHQRVKPTDLTIAIAHDDAGIPITGHDLQREFRKRAPRGFPKDLTPVADPDCTDDEWEKLIMVEQIKFRRRSAQ